MQEIKQASKTIKTLHELSSLLDYSLINTLKCDPQATSDGVDHYPRQVFNGHFVPVRPTPIAEPIYIAHSETFFKELGFCDSLATSKEFMQLFSGDTSELGEPFKKAGWATGYALSIYGSEYYDQCPFKTGNGYGDGRAVSIVELVTKTKNERYEMQLKGGGRTPYCRGADGRAVLRSSVREFLAQEHMYALGINTSRSLTLYTSTSEQVQRPWFTNGSYSRDPEVMIAEDVAITTRVAPSFLRVGQIELFARRARKNEHPEAMQELKEIVMHLIEREYSDVISDALAFEKQIVHLAFEFRKRLTSLVANWIRVGYCQGNFNSDNCAAGGFTLDYGPFGFIDQFHPKYQPWTGGGAHFSFLNQPNAAQQNFHMFYTALLPLLNEHEKEQQELQNIHDDFAKVMQASMMSMWASKLGLERFDATLVNELMMLMIEASVDYTIFFRELSNIPEDIAPLSKSFYNDAVLDKKIVEKFSTWLEAWKAQVNVNDDASRAELSEKMKRVNPKYTLREWFLVPAYKAAQQGDYALVKELQAVMNKPYDEQSSEVEEKYYREKPSEFFDIAGISHVSCSS